MTRNLFLATLLLLSITAPLHASLTPNTEYYLWLNIYEKLLGQNEDGTAPAISAYGLNADANSYVFVAEDCGKDGYVLLRQKSSGHYFAASSSNNWSTVFEDYRSTDDRFCWKVSEGTYSYLINKKNGKYLGVDGAHKGSNYVSVYYDKPKGSHSQFSVIPVVGADWDEARAAYVSPEYTNAQGVREIDYCLVKDLQIDRDDDIDIHITANTNPIQGSTSKINLGSDSTWLIIDNIVPSEVTSSFLKYVTIKGKKATKDSNCRVAIYLNGAAIIPLPSAPMTCESTIGQFTLSAANHTDLSRKSNTITSFTLRRGYMATVATGTKGTGYSRVFVADHADLQVTLPTALNKRISSIYIKPWQYVSKKGWGYTGGSTGGSRVRATWYWTWSAGYSSTADMEYVPCRQHLYWPSASEVNSKTATAALSLNEPEHSEQHESSDCSCGGTIDPWKAYTINSSFFAGGGRIGSPQPTDFSYLTQYCQYIDNMASRCDFAVTHAYWNFSGYSESSYADWFASQCKSIWTSTGRPLWITEMEVGSSWGNKFSDYESYRKYVQVLLQKLDECDYVERYFLYAVDYWVTYLYYDANPMSSLTPAGQVYRDHRATFAYNSKYTKIPTWWAPSAKTPSLHVKQSASTGKLTFIINNPNTDMTNRLLIERQNADESWSTFYELTDRYRLDNESLNITGVDPQDVNLDTDHFRITIVTLNGKTVNSSMADAGYINNPGIETGSKSSVDGWNCTRDAANGFTKDTGDTYFEVWDANANTINFDYYQDITDLDNGVYQLSANVFNTVDGVLGASVNGAVVLYAQTNTQLYATPITEDIAIDGKALDISEIPLTEVKNILVTDGRLRVGVRNLGIMGARWAGADNFQLTYVGKTSTIDKATARVENDLALYALMPLILDGNIDSTQFTPYTTPRDASRFIVNPDCNRKNSYGWTATNVDVKTDNEAYDGIASNSYWNIWKSGAFSSSLKQDITGLPEGTYTFGAILRGQETAAFTLTAKTVNDQATASFTGTGAVPAEGAQYPQGWQQVTTGPVKVATGETLSISMEMVASGTAWWSADHFTLTLVDVPETVTGIAAAQENSDDFSVTTWGLYDLSGRQISTGNPVNRQIKKGLYILNGRKVIIK